MSEPATEFDDLRDSRHGDVRFSQLRALLRQNALALISLTVALFGLGYNTWRNETTEHHRNVRQSAFIALAALGEVQQLADTRFFGGQRDEANRIAIWGRITLIRDVATLVSVATDDRAKVLFETWSNQSMPFDEGDAAAEKAVAAAVRETRAQVLRELQRLK